MWRSKCKMWRAQPLLSAATCPAGSKTSCCESYFRAFLSLNLVSHSLLCFFSLIWFFTKPSCVFFPASSFQNFFSLHPLSKHCLSWFFLSIYPSNTCFIFLFIISPSMPFLLASVFSALGLSQLLFSLVCHSFLMWRFDLHQLILLLLQVAATISLSPWASAHYCRGIISNILQESVYLNK